jgi:hypothetical protein
LKKQFDNLVQNLQEPIFKEEDGLVFRNNLLYIPPGPVRDDALFSAHDSLTAGHFGIRRTIELISRDFWWPSLRKSVTEYVKTCNICNQTKTFPQKPPGLLMPLPAPSRPWTSISMDQIVELPKSRNFDSVLVIVDRMTKQAHFVPTSKKLSSSQTAKIYLEHVFRLHGSPEQIVSDRGPQFVATFWKRFHELLGTKVSLSTAFHPQTDGQTERMNQVLEQYLRIFCNDQQNNWTNLLPLAEFAYNNSIHSSTGLSPFKANYGFDPSATFRFSQHSLVPSAEERVEELQAVHSQLKDSIVKAQERYKYFANRRRQESTEFDIGDLVWLDRRNIKTRRPINKLDVKRIGPFRISEIINPVAYRLDLQDALVGKIHDVFHVSLLTPYRARSENQVPPLSSQLEVDDHADYAIDCILDSVFTDNELKYLVRFKNLDSASDTWLSQAQLIDCQDLVHKFHESYPDKPKPLTIKIRNHTLEKPLLIHLRLPKEGIMSGHRDLSSININDFLQDNGSSKDYTQSGAINDVNEPRNGIALRHDSLATRRHKSFIRDI